MDKTAMVKSDQEIEGLVMEALSRIKMPVTLLRWNYAPQVDEWQLIIATPWYDDKGPLTTVRAAYDAFKGIGIYDDVPTRRVFFKSPNDTLVKTLEQESSTETEGTIHLLRERGSGEEPKYSVVFAPFLGQGGFVPSKRFQDAQGLRKFLLSALHLRQRLVDDALDELASTRSASIYPVSLQERELRKVGLA